MVVYVLSLLVVGFVVGAIARFLLPGPDPMGCLGTAVVGVLGSLVGGFLGDLLFAHRGSSASFHPVGIVGSVAGAMVLLGILRLFRSR